jgi:hypothetical protein
MFRPLMQVQTVRSSPSSANAVPGPDDFSTSGFDHNRPASIEWAHGPKLLD